MTNQPEARNSSYVEPHHQLTGQPPLSTEQAVTLVVHEIHGLWVSFRQTRSRDVLMKFIERSIYLQHLGFELILIKRQDCVCARRKEVATCVH